MTDTLISFNENYATLKAVSEKLRTQTEPDIDNLIPLVEQGVKAYSACKERIQSVRKAFDDLLLSDEKE